MEAGQEILVYIDLSEISWPENDDETRFKPRDHPNIFRCHPGHGFGCSCELPKICAKHSTNIENPAVATGGNDRGWPRDFGLYRLFRNLLAGKWRGNTITPWDQPNIFVATRRNGDGCSGELPKIRAIVSRILKTAVTTAKNDGSWPRDFGLYSLFGNPLAEKQRKVPIKPRDHPNIFHCHPGAIAVIYVS